MQWIKKSTYDKLFQALRSGKKLFKELNAIPSKYLFHDIFFHTNQLITTILTPVVNKTELVDQLTGWQEICDCLENDFLKIDTPISKQKVCLMSLKGYFADFKALITEDINAALTISNIIANSHEYLESNSMSLIIARKEIDKFYQSLDFTQLNKYYAKPLELPTATAKTNTYTVATLISGTFVALQTFNGTIGDNIDNLLKNAAWNELAEFTSKDLLAAIAFIITVVLGYLAYHENKKKPAKDEQKAIGFAFFAADAEPGSKVKLPTNDQETVIEVSKLSNHEFGYKAKFFNEKTVAKNTESQPLLANNNNNRYD